MNTGPSKPRSIRAFAAFPSGITSLLAVLLLLGCRGEDAPGAAVAPNSAPTRAAARATPPQATPTPTAPKFSEIVWTTDWSNAPGQEPVPASELSADAPVIIALTRARALPADARVDATWTYNNTSLDAFATQVVTESARHDVWLAFRLDRNPDIPWPAGTYQVVLSLDGVEVQRGLIQVVESP